MLSLCTAVTLNLLQHPLLSNLEPCCQAVVRRLATGDPRECYLVLGATAVDRWFLGEMRKAGRKKLCYLGQAMTT